MKGKELPEASYVLAEGSFDANECIKRAYAVLFEHTYQKLQLKKQKNESNKT